MDNKQPTSSLIPRRHNRVARIAIRATLSEVRDLHQRAATSACSVSNYVRMAIGRDNQTQSPVISRENLKTAANLVKINSGLSYLIRLCERQRVPIDEIRPVVQAVQEVIWTLAAELRGVKE